ncbi:glycosyltransferase [Schinkia azotoformans]|uniref:glycosyltransferase n=1 Tax=Schinkia azotoformans TaxID=1454 RepID=UPI002DBBF065|nr:glycosyltransferase [Schinkia azotoformans]MEC1714816.1 glycosyltransferase [Schinkia azotoformans]MEC1741722.1 glycosyltransferase [Schinkia azotoformans]MEC1766600.1 glycosyltransferase [Schinkia azotoformans]MEC1788015.1 glycosyltransferase [Schinkia azotoformans]MED4375419.1 glycosyltransferase [Schinkia azotoformans]
MSIKYKKQKRIVMITPDQMIDRRILIEAETLLKEGYEVYVIAGWDGNQIDLFEELDGIKIERIKYEGIDKRIEHLYKIQSKAINKLNDISTKYNNLFGKIAQKFTTKVNNVINNRTSCVNQSSIFLQNKFTKWAVKNINRRLINRLINKMSGLSIRFLGLYLRGLNLLSIKKLGLVNKIITILLKAKNFIVGTTGKIINKLVYLCARVFPKLMELNGYEHAYYQSAVFYNPDIIHVHDLPMLKIGMKVKKDLGIPLVYDMHEFYPEQDVFTKQQQQYLRKTERKYINQCDSLITVNPLLAEEISKTYGDIKINVIQNATVLPEGFHNREYDRFREEYGVSKDEFILLYQGWISEHRNIQNLVRGMSLVDKPVKLVIMGYGDYKNELEKICESLGIRDKVLFVPAKSQKELLSYTASADVGIIPYPFGLDPNTKYASPNKLYEFIASQLPILCNNLPFVKSVVEKNEFGQVIELETPEDFAHALNSFPFEKLHVFKNNLLNNGENYIWEKEKINLLNIYRHIDTSI